MTGAEEGPSIHLDPYPDSDAARIDDANSKR